MAVEPHARGRQSRTGWRRRGGPEARSEGRNDLDQFLRRPRNRSAQQAGATCRQRCWKPRLGHRPGRGALLRQRRVVLLLKAVWRTARPWGQRYVKRWRGAAAAAGRTVHQRDREPREGPGMPAGGPLHALRVRRVDAREHPGSRSSVPTTRSCVASPKPRPSVWWWRSNRWPRSGCDCTRPRPRSWTARRTTARRLWHTEFTFLGSRSTPRSAKQSRGQLHRIRARDQQARTD